MMRRMWDESSESDDDDYSPGPDWFYNHFILAMAMAMQLREEDMRDDMPGSSSGSSSRHHPASGRPSTSKENPAPSPPLSSLEAITVSELFRKKRHCGRVLYGKFCVEPVTSLSSDDMVTVLVDTNASPVRVITTKLLWQTSPTIFSLGTQLAIKEPSMEMCSDGMNAVRVNSFAQIVCLHSENADCSSPAEATDGRGTLLEELERIRFEGNRHFAEKDWAEAVKWYSKCISQALRTPPNDNGSPAEASQNFNRVLMFTYSNRAEARFRLHQYEDALSDADEALKFEPRHLKTLLRKGRASHRLGLFEKACTSFKAALEECPGEQSIASNLAASTASLKQSSTGAYDLSEFFLAFGSIEAPSCADFVGPVEIGRVSYGSGRRGLFATRNVKAGELLLVSNPLAVSRQKVPGSTLSKLAYVNCRNNLFSEVAKRVQTSKRQKAQLFSLCSRGSDDMQVPSMEIFRIGSEWVPEDLGEFEESESDRIREIVDLNVTERVQRWRLPNSRIFSLCIWPLPSFANHSCNPNVIHTYIGDAIFFRASVDIAKGEELTISYLDHDSELLEGVDARQAETKRVWDFICKCSRCLLEETLREKLSKISNKFRSQRMEARPSKTCGKDKAARERKNIANLVDEVEVVIQSNKLGQKEQGWIRVLFLEAYMIKFHLAVAKRDSEYLWNVVLDSTISVCAGPLALTRASVLLTFVERWHTKRSQSYRLTLDRVLGIYRVYFGKQPEDVLLKLIRSKQKEHGVAIPNY